MPANAWKAVFQSIQEKYTAADPAKPQIRPAQKHEAVLLESKFNDLERVTIYERRSTPLERFADRALSYASVWAGTPESAIEHLKRERIEIIEGPVTRIGGRGKGVSVYFRDPDGNLLELISYTTNAA